MPLTVTPIAVGYPQDGQAFPGRELLDYRARWHDTELGQGLLNQRLYIYRF